MAGLSFLLRNTLRHVRRFRRHDGGSMAIMMGLTAIPLIFAVGAGIDYGTANMTKAKLDQWPTPPRCLRSTTRP